MYNPEKADYEWKEVETDKYVFDETDKIAIAREYHERRCPASEIVAKYYINSAVVLYGWLDKYLNENVYVSLQAETDNETDMSKKSKQQQEEELKAMKKENKRLQEALELEKLRSKAYDTMIDEKKVRWNFDSEAVNIRRTSTSR